MNRTLHHPIPRSLARRPAFTLVEILISILILALGVLGLGALFPVIIREQRLGTDAASGVSVSNSARVILTDGQWGAALGRANGGQVHPALAPGRDAATQFLWNVMRNPHAYDVNPMRVSQPITAGLGLGWRSPNNNTFQPYGQGEWFTSLLDAVPTSLTRGSTKIGYPGPGTVYYMTRNGSTYIEQQAPGFVNIPMAQRLFPVSPELTPQFVWDFAVQRVPTFEHNHSPSEDALRAVVIVRRLDPRLRPVGSATSLRDAILNYSGTVSAIDQRFPVGEDAATGQPTLDGTGNYSGIKTCEMEFFFDPATPAMNYRDRLYVPTAWAAPTGIPANNILRQLWAQMKQPGQKLVDNLGNIYTVVGSGNEPGVAGAQDFDLVAGGDYLKVDPQIPESITIDRASPAAAGTAYEPGNYTSRAIWQVAFTPQIPVSVTLVELAKGSGQ